MGIVQEIGHTTEWHMDKAEFILKNKTHKILWDFELQMSHLISARTPELVTVFKGL